MNCQSCKFKYDNTNKLPKILITCGHTFCLDCLERKKEKSSETQIRIKCFICSVVTTTETIENLPKNMAILENKEKKNITQKESLCDLHSKEIEAFCDNDKTMLCVSCIIENNHKNHNLSSIDKVI